MKKKSLNLILYFGLYIIICLSIIVSGCAVKPSREYGVFLGINSEQKERLRDYRIVVIEPSEFSTDQISELRKSGKKVYGYINIGAIEKYRPYFDRFKDKTLGTYKEWPNERWVDVSDAEWQRFVVDELGKKYSEMGFDGFFIDNADVYHHYHTDSTFKGLCSILKGLKSYKLSILINGGDVFVSRCMDEKIANTLFDGINQETVFTDIDFERKSYGKQAVKETRYFKEYLSRVKKNGLSVYLLEYGADASLAKEIDNYCKKNGFHWYNAKNLELR